MASVTHSIHKLIVVGIQSSSLSSMFTKSCNMRLSHIEALIWRSSSMSSQRRLSVTNLFSANSAWHPAHYNYHNIKLMVNKNYFRDE
jgi:hypothetical protein